MRVEWKSRLRKLNSLPGYAELKTEKLLSRTHCHWSEIYQSARAATEPIPDHAEFLLPIGFTIRDAIRAHGLSTSRAYDKVKDSLGLSTSVTVRRMFARHKSWNWDLDRNTDAWVKIAELWHAKYSKLPLPKWLLVHGYGGLSIQLRKHPKRFAHLEQSKSSRSLAEWVEIAETLAAENNGLLPSIRKCGEKGFRRLGGVIWSHREAFAHIRRAKTKAE